MPDFNIPMAEYGGGSGEELATEHQQAIARLLQTSELRYWRDALVEMLRHKSMPEVHQILKFFLSNIDSALEAYQNERSNVLIDVAATPDGLDLVRWRRVLIGINLVLCEPDTNFDIRNIGVSYGQRTNHLSLKGMKIILKSLLAIPWEMVVFILKLNLSQASTLYETLTDVTRGYGIPMFCYSGIKRMYDLEEYRSMLRYVGFYRLSPQEPITWTSDDKRASHIESLLYVLHGLYRTPSGIQTSTR